MPELYGHPRKDELRRQIREHLNDLNNEVREHRKTRKALELAQARIALLTKKTQLMEGKLKDLLAEASKEISFNDVWEEAEKQRHARREAFWAANAEAEASA